MLLDTTCQVLRRPRVIPAPRESSRQPWEAFLAVNAGSATTARQAVPPPLNTTVPMRPTNIRLTTTAQLEVALLCQFHWVISPNPTLLHTSTTANLFEGATSSRGARKEPKHLFLSGKVAIATTEQTILRLSEKPLFQWTKPRGTFSWVGLSASKLLSLFRSRSVLSPSLTASG